MYLQVSMIATYPLMIRTINNRIVRAGTLFIIMFFTIYDFFSFFNSEIWRDSFIEYHTILNLLFGDDRYECIICCICGS